LYLNTTVNNYQKLFYLALVAGFATRILFLIFFTDLNNLEYYEYGAINQNIHSGNGYALFYFAGDYVKHEFNSTKKPFVSAFIPPVYVYYLYPFFFIQDISLRNASIILSQILLSLLVIFLLFKLTSEISDKITGVIASFIYAIFPEFIYANCSFNGTLLFHIGILLIFIVIHKIDSTQLPKKHTVLSGIIFGILILMRTEVVLFLLIVICYLIFEKKTKLSLTIFFVAFIIISPWMLRNFLVFEDFVPLSTSFGVNFYRGHNPYAVGVWADDGIAQELKKFENDPKFEQRMNVLMFRHGIKSIKDNPGRDVIVSLEKIIQLWLINYSDPRVFHTLYLIPALILFILFVIGFYKFYSWEKHKYLLLFFIYFTLTIFIFFSLPRYQSMMKIAMLPFTAEGLMFLWKKIKSPIKPIIQ
jgi:4-amino-4-deoxy-L-arabinose transferase-like glycosyltransferase